ncbi:MAG: hypothetical protein OEY01_03510 [Desulfobulbaceae bacterium]|nr:hypothetical protein [Desulfobulbaceae bacterium]
MEYGKLLLETKYRKKWRNTEGIVTIALFYQGRWNITDQYDESDYPDL